MTRWIWRIIQATIVLVPTYWMLTDPKVNTDPKYVLGVPALMCGIALLITEISTRAWDAVVFSPLFRRRPKVRQFGGKVLGSPASDLLPRELPEERKSGRIGKEPR